MFSKFIDYAAKIKKNGVVKSFRIIWECKIDVIIRWVVLQFVRKRPLENIIIFSSHNDFDTNGGAFYDWLIANKYNKKYKLVWLLRNNEYAPDNLPENVECYYWKYPNLKRDIRICTAKYFLADDWVQEKVRDEQKSLYCSHGIGGLKKVTGMIRLPESIDYVLMPAESYATVVAEQLSLSYPNSKCISVGYPLDDLLYMDNKSELLKVTKQNFSKIVVWMPTFRKGFKGDRVDGRWDTPLGIPLLSSIDEYELLNDLLKAHNMLLIIKLHPMQYIENIKITSLSNTCILDKYDLKRKQIDNYRLLSCTDALISDYSSAAGDYLHTDNPIAYVFDDMAEYKLGLISEDLDAFTAGDYIYNFNDLCSFLTDVACGHDEYKEKRKYLREMIFQYRDAQSSKRLAEFLRL